MAETKTTMATVKIKVTSGSTGTVHGYHLYTGIRRIQPWVKSDPSVLINTFSGIINGPNKLETHENSFVSIRCDVNKAPEFFHLAGQKIVIGHGSVTMGIPTIHPIIPESKLFARSVRINLANNRSNVEPETFLLAVNRQLAELGIKGQASLLERKILRVKNAIIPTYGVMVADLDDASSILLQSVGIGGSKKMGCGFFQPVKRSPEFDWECA